MKRMKPWERASFVDRSQQWAEWKREEERCHFVGHQFDDDWPWCRVCGKDREEVA